MVRTLISGVATRVPGVEYLHRKLLRVHGTDSARYCYSVWLRHLRMLHDHGQCRSVPRVVAELGPGESIGMGLAALLSGAESYCGLDVISLARTERNLEVLAGLVELFQQRASIPGPEEYPEVNPGLGDYASADLLSSMNLEPERLERIRYSVLHPNAPDSMIRYVAPWWDSQVIKSGTVDLIFSQAVLEHVADLPKAFAAMKAWLRAGGVMSHQIDLRCHATAAAWDGHRAYSDRMWAVMRGARPYFINREPASKHLALMSSAGFDVMHQTRVSAKPSLNRASLGRSFRDLADDDLATSGIYVLARVPSAVDGS